MSTIGPYLQEWKKERRASPVVPYASLPLDVSKLMEELWRMALAWAEKSFLDERAKIDGENERLRREIIHLASALDDTRRQLTASQQRVERAEEDFIRTQQELAVATATQQELRGALSRLEGQYTELQRDSETLRAQLRADLRKAEDATAVERQRTEERVTAMQRAVDEAMANATAARQEALIAASDAQRRREVLQAQLDAARESRDSLTKEVEQLKAEAHKYQAKAASSETLLTRMQTEVTGLERRLDEAQQTITGLRREIAGREEADDKRIMQIGELTGTVSTLREQMQAAR
jgi:chromosome segregation ATPase